MKFTKLISSRTSIFIIFIAFTFVSLYSAQDTVKIKIVETSDVHGSLFPFDFSKKMRSTYSLANVCTYLNIERAKKDQELLLLDNGDILQGQPLVYYFNVEKNLSVNICSDVMNYLKYDAATVGNHDIETGHNVYDKVKKEFNFPWLAANAINDSSNQPYFTPYTVFNKNGVKIAVLGLITPYIPNWLPENLWKNIRFEDMIETAKKWVPIIKEKEKPDIMIGLFHAGLEYNYNNQSADTPLNENASQLVAERVPGFDVVFVGHDHIGWNKKVKNVEGKEVLIMGTTSNAKDIAVATIKLFTDSSTNKPSKSITGEIIETNQFEVDRNFLSKYVGVIKEVNRFTSKTIGTFTDSISTCESMFGNSAFVDLVHKIQLFYTKADISFTAPLTFDATIKKGPVYIRDMFRLYKYENFLYTMWLSGQEIKDYLEFSFANWFNQMKGPNDNLLLFKKDDDGKIVSSNNTKALQLKSQYYNFCSAAGIKYEVDVSKPAGSKVKIISMQNGTPFDLNKYYKVALNSYRANGGGGHLTEGAQIPKEEIKKRFINSTPRDLRFYIIRWIETLKTIEPKPFGNWKLIPEEWVKNAIPRDYNYLFGK